SVASPGSARMRQVGLCFMFRIHPNGANFRRGFVRSLTCPGPYFSRVGASRKPNVVQYNTRKSHYSNAIGDADSIAVHTFKAKSAATGWAAAFIASVGSCSSILTAKIAASAITLYM